MFCSCFRAHGGACWWDIRCFVPVLGPMVGHAGGILMYMCFVPVLGPMVGHAGGILGVLFLF